MTKRFLPYFACAPICALLFAVPTYASVSPEEAEKLKTVLTPLGGERAGNKEGTIPAWTGGYTTPISGFNNTDRRTDPFASDKLLYTVNAVNLDQYVSKLTEGTIAMLKKYPDTFKLEVYPTRRTAAAPQWVYDNTAKNALTAHMDGEIVTGAHGGIPFPIPATGREVIANHTLHWRGEAWMTDVRGYLGTPDGSLVMTVQATGNYQLPYYYKDKANTSNGEYWLVRLVNSGPAVRAGEAVVGRLNLDEEKSQAWVYLTGQRRVRKLPNACCDTPTPATAGVMNFDELDVIGGRLDRFNWKILGKKEMLIPYNSNRILTPLHDTDLLMPHHVNPAHVRWELHRVWVLEYALKPGARHVEPKGKIYVDEDTWIAVLGDRWDAKGQLWKTMWQYPIVMPDLPATNSMGAGFNDLQSGAWYYAGVFNERSSAQYKIMPRRPDDIFTPDALAAQGVR